MNTLRILHITDQLSPFTSDSDQAKHSRLLCRGLADLGLAVTVVVPIQTATRAANHGLARRLSPMSIPGRDSQVTLYEGKVPGSRVDVLAVETMGNDLPEDTFCAAVMALACHPDRQPDVILATHGGERVLSAFAEAALDPAPTRFFALHHLDDSPELARALGHSDRIIVSSPAWAAALERDPGGQAGSQLLVPVADRIRGVIASVDTVDWNPRRDPYLPENFASDPRGHKALYKEDLQRRFGLKISPTTPLIALVGPLDPAILPYSASSEISQLDLQLIVLADASRDARCLRGLSRLANQSSSSIALHTPDDPGEARAFEHLLLGAADLALFARHSRPGPLCELYCMHYGAVPIAPREGSFADLLVEFDRTTNTGNGYLFTGNYSEEIVRAVERATRVYRKPTSHSVLAERVMAMNLSWAITAQRYANLLVDTLREKGRLAA